MRLHDGVMLVVMKSRTPSFVLPKGAMPGIAGRTAGAGRLVSRDPANGQQVGDVEITSVERIGAAVARARAAQPGWAALGASGRAALLSDAATRLIERAEILGRLITREMGKPLAEAIAEVRFCGAGADGQLAEVAAAIAPELLEDARTRSTIYHDPFGVCAVITPWNFPLGMPHSMVFPALATGNTVVLKPSEETPLTGQAYADLLNEVLPRGVLEVVHGSDLQGKALVAAPVDLIAFTGSRAAGKHILAAAAPSLKRVILELGGKDPLVVLDDADLAAAARFAARGSFRNAGQVCVATERIYVPASKLDAFVELLTAEAAGWRQGNGLEPGTKIGPMVSERQRNHVLGQIGSAVADGARVAAGGGHLGNFIEPTILVGVTPDMAIAREETFGPVACVTAVADEDEAVRLANDTPYGLGAVVFGSSARAELVARRLTAGMIGVNQSVGGATGTPWVGARESGYGFHGSRDGHRNFTQTRVLSQPVAK